MNELLISVTQLVQSMSPLWLAALAGAFVVMICESAKPKPADDDAKPTPNILVLAAMLISLLTPLLLFLHAWTTTPTPPTAIIALIGAVVVIAALIGWSIAAFAQPLGRVFSRAAPWLALAVFALTLYVTWTSLLAMVGSLAHRSAG